MTKTTTKQPTINLKFKQGILGCSDTIFRYIIEWGLPGDETLHVLDRHVYRDKSVSENRYVLTLQADGSYRNQNGCEYVIAKIDRRPKPFSVESREEGRGPKTTRKFATIEELKAYVLGRWQGWDYYDGGDSFHGDYATFEVKGAKLADLVPARDFSELRELMSESSDYLDFASRQGI